MNQKFAEVQKEFLTRIDSAKRAGDKIAEQTAIDDYICFAADCVEAFLFGLRQANESQGLNLRDLLRAVVSDCQAELLEEMEGETQRRLARIAAQVFKLEQQLVRVVDLVVDLESRIEVIRGR